MMTLAIVELWGGAYRARRWEGAESDARAFAARRAARGVTCWVEWLRPGDWTTADGGAVS